MELEMITDGLKNCCWKTIIVQQPSNFMRENGKKSRLSS